MEIVKLVHEFLKTLIWPSVVIFFLIYFNTQVSNIFERLKTAELPGGISLEMDAKIQEVEALSKKVGEEIKQEEDEHKGIPVIPLTEANSKLIELGFRPSPSGVDLDYYRNIADRNPTLALAGLIIEFDIVTMNLAKGYKVDLDGKNDTSLQLLDKLLDRGAISSAQYLLASQVLNLANKAVNNVSVSREQALSIINSADVLIEDYLSWLSFSQNVIVP